MDHWGFAQELMSAGFGLGVGLCLGMLGAGGSIVAIPALVYGLGLPVEDAIPTSLLVVGSAAAAGMWTHVRAGHVHWRTALPFGASGVVGSVAGSALSTRVASDRLLGAFGGVMILAAIAMLLRARAAPKAASAPALAASPAPGAAVNRVLPGVPRVRLAPVLVTGAGVGVLTGLFGVGGGFLIVPPMVLLLRMTMPVAIGTSLVVIVINASAALVAHLGSGSIDVAIAVAFAVGGLVGALAGGAMSGRIPARWLARSFAYVVLALATIVIYESV